jgi:hypothetical protein
VGGKKWCNHKFEHGQMENFTRHKLSLRPPLNPNPNTFIYPSQF